MCAVPLLPSATVRAAPSIALLESPVSTIGLAAPFSAYVPSGAVGRSPRQPTPSPGAPYTMHAFSSVLNSPDGKGRPMAPAVARPLTLSPTSDCTFSNRPSTNSRVPSRGSTKTQQSSRLTNGISSAAADTVSPKSKRSRRSGFEVGVTSCAEAAAAAAASPSSSPTIVRPGHAARKAVTIASCARRSASVSASRASSDLYVTLPSPAILFECTARISSQPRDAASAQVDSMAASGTFSTPGAVITFSDPGADIRTRAEVVEASATSSPATRMKSRRRRRGRPRGRARSEIALKWPACSHALRRWPNRGAL